MHNGERAVFSVMGQLSAEYSRGLWDFIKFDGQPLYIRLDGEARVGIRWHGNDFKGNVMTDAARIFACLIAFSSLSFDDPTDLTAQAYHRLHHFAADHPEAHAIFRATD